MSVRDTPENILRPVAQMCAATITTQYAAEAILMLCQMFSMEPEEDLPSWIEELKLHFPDLAAAVFTASRDE